MSQLKAFGSPEKYVQGPNATAHLGEEMLKLGMKGPVVVVSSGTPKRILGSIWANSLQDAGYTFSDLSFGGVCTKSEAEKIASYAKSIKANSLVAFGGGQIIDAVRAASIEAACEVVTCPTLASTDAPCSTLCVMYHDDHSFMEYLLLVDTNAVAQAPSRMLVGGLGDALATFFEARSVRECNGDNFLGGKQTSAGFALSKLSYEILIEDGVAGVAAVDANAVTPALERVIEANTLLSGLGFEVSCGDKSIIYSTSTLRRCSYSLEESSIAFLMKHYHNR